MDKTALILGTSLVGLAMVMILLGLPLLMRKIPMNRGYGARFKKSFESEENWYRINAYSAKQLILWSLPLMIIGMATLFLPLAEHPGWTQALALSPLLTVAPCLLSYRHAKKL